MQYFLKINKLKLDYNSDEYLLGEQSFNNFWSSNGFDKIMKLIKNNNIANQLSVLQSNGKEISIEQFVSMISKLNIEDRG